MVDTIVTMDITLHLVVKVYALVIMNMNKLQDSTYLSHLHSLACNRFMFS